MHDTRPALTPERILEAAEDVLRRFGPAKATVVDVARALGVSHGSVYRHFPSKAALRDAVTERWLARVVRAAGGRSPPSDGPAPERLRRWFDVLIAAKRDKARDDPELFATYMPARAGSAARSSGRTSTTWPASSRGSSPTGSAAASSRSPTRAGAGPRRLRRDRPLPQPGPRRGVDRPRHEGRVRGRVAADPQRPGRAAAVSQPFAGPRSSHTRVCLTVRSPARTAPARRRWPARGTASRGRNARSGSPTSTRAPPLGGPPQERQHPVGHRLAVEDVPGQDHLGVRGVAVQEVGLLDGRPSRRWPRR